VNPQIKQLTLAGNPLSRLRGACPLFTSPRRATTGGGVPEGQSLRLPGMPRAFTGVATTGSEAHSRGARPAPCLHSLLSNTACGASDAWAGLNACDFAGELPAPVEAEGRSRLR
jgi:hypothetical protein